MAIECTFTGAKVLRADEVFTVGKGDDARELTAALRAGAFAVVDRPRTARDLETLLEVLRRCVTRHYKDQWPA